MKEKAYFGNKVNVPKLCKTKKGWLLFSTSLLIGIGIQSINFVKADVINDAQINLENKDLSQIDYPNSVDNNNNINQEKESENKTITSDDKTNIKIDFNKTGINQTTNEDSVTYEVGLKDNVQTNNIDYSTKYVPDETKEAGVQVVKTPGQQGTSINFEATTIDASSKLKQGTNQLTQINSDENNINKTTNQIVIGTDVDYNHDISNNPDDTKLYYSSLYASANILLSYLNGSYLSNVTNDPYTVFAVNNKGYSDKTWSDIESVMNDADKAKDYLEENGLYSDAMATWYNATKTWYDRLEIIHNGQNNSNYTPQINYEEDAFGIDNQERKDIDEFLQTLPVNLRRLFVIINGVGEKQAQLTMKGVLANSNGQREIKLNSIYNSLVDDLKHEVGHIVDFMSGVYDGNKFVNSFSRTDEWNKVYQNSYVGNKKFTSYISNSPHEAFADGFGRWIDYKYLNNQKAFDNLNENAKLYFEKLDNLYFADVDSSNIQTKEPVDEIVLVGTKPKIETKVEKYSTKYVKNDQLEKDKQNLIQTGKNKVITTKTTYTLNNDGSLISNKETFIDNGQDEIIEIGTKELLSEAENNPELNQIDLELNQNDSKSTQNIEQIEQNLDGFEEIENNDIKQDTLAKDDEEKEIVQQDLNDKISDDKSKSNEIDLDKLQINNHNQESLTNDKFEQISFSSNNNQRPNSTSLNQSSVNSSKFTNNKNLDSTNSRKSVSNYKQNNNDLSFTEYLILSDLPQTGEKSSKRGLFYLIFVALCLNLLLLGLKSLVDK